MERVVEVATPEAIDLRYEVAGIGSRFVALAIDTLVQIVLGIALGIAGVFGFALVAATLGRAASSAEEGLVAIAAFTVSFGYFVIFEAVRNGRTIGKQVVGLRVIRLDATPIDWLASLVRNTMRIVEALLGLYLISVIVAFRSSRNQRIGDIVAGTMVVWDRFEPLDAEF